MDTAEQGQEKWNNGYNKHCYMECKTIETETELKQENTYSNDYRNKQKVKRD